MYIFLVTEKYVKSKLYCISHLIWAVKLLQICWLPLPLPPPPRPPPPPLPPPLGLASASSISTATMTNSSSNRGSDNFIICLACAVGTVGLVLIAWTDCNALIATFCATPPHIRYRAVLAKKIAMYLRNFLSLSFWNKFVGSPLPRTVCEKERGKKGGGEGVCPALTYSTCTYVSFVVAYVVIPDLCNQTNLLDEYLSKYVVHFCP